MSPTYNVEKKPLEEVQIQISEDGVRKNVQALSKYFASFREMNEYVRPPSLSENGSFLLGAKESWISSTEHVVEDFSWLLGLEYHRFWSELRFNKGSLDGLVSFLQEGYPYYSLDLLPQDYDITHLYHKTCHLAFLIIKRILTRVESEREYMSEDSYSNLLYNNFIISVPMMLDICIIYGHSNQKEVVQLLDFVLTIQPLYKEDLHKMIANVKCVYSNIKDRLCQGGISEYGGIAKLKDRKEELSSSDLEDILLYLLDVTLSLAMFTQLCPIAAVYMHQHRLEVTLATFYVSFMPDVAHHIKRFCQDEALIGLYINSVLKMNQIRYHIIQLFYHCLIVSLETNLQLWKWTEEEIKEEIEGRLDVISECLGEKAFIKDLNCQYPIDIMIHTMSSQISESNQLDTIKIKFIIDSLPSIIGPTGIKQNSNKSSMRKNSDKMTNGVVGGSSGSGSNSHSGAVQSNNQELSSSSSSQFEDKPGSSAPVEDSIKELKEIFPHLGEGFLMKCFEYYGNSRSTVLNAILENTLPDELSRIDPSLPIIPPDPDEGRPLPQRINVFDNDEFDIMTRDTMDTSRIHRGKRKDQYRDLSEMLNDKCQIENLKESYAKYSNIVVDEEIDYDDEYDDSYDSVPVPAPDEDEPDKNFVTPRVLQQTRGWKKNQQEEEEEVEEEEEENSSQQNKNGFVPFAENPELIREKWQQKRQRNQQQRDYQGKPKGQGQDDHILYNRHKKNVNKSSSANHNRRKQAQNKRMHGMVPS